MSNFYLDVIKFHPLFASSSRVSTPAMLEPKTRAAVEEIIASSSIPLMLFETYRSTQRQLTLFNLGKTKLKTVGVHHYGLAADIVKSVNGQPSWEGDFLFLAELADKVGLISGQNWGTPNVHHTFIDADHVQRCSIADQGKLFAGTWYPDDEYDPTV